MQGTDRSEYAVNDDVASGHHKIIFPHDQIVDSVFDQPHPVDGLGAEANVFPFFCFGEIGVYRTPLQKTFVVDRNRIERIVKRNKRRIDHHVCRRHLKGGFCKFGSVDKKLLQLVSRVGDNLQIDCFAHRCGTAVAKNPPAFAFADRNGINNRFEFRRNHNGFRRHDKQIIVLIRASRKFAVGNTVEINTVRNQAITAVGRDAEAYLSAIECGAPRQNGNRTARKTSDTDCMRNQFDADPTGIQGRIACRFKQIGVEISCAIGIKVPTVKDILFSDGIVGKRQLRSGRNPDGGNG